jgi:hypothetical protein
VEARLVLSFRAAGGKGRGFFERARALIDRARALQGVVVAWDALRIAFAFEVEKLLGVLSLASTDGEDTLDGDTPWAIGLAQGELKPLQLDANKKEGGLAWGPALVAASILSSAAKPGEMLIAKSVRTQGLAPLLSHGYRNGHDGMLRVRGLRVDRRQPWRDRAIERLSSMRVPSLVRTALPKIEIAPGSVVLLRGDPGMGGTRLLNELASRLPRALVVSPVGSGFEPLGALRRAIGRSITRELSPRLLELALPLEALLSGEGVPLEMASRLVSAFLWPKTNAGVPGVLVIDDAKTIDPSSLEACVRAARGSTSFGLAARLDATSGLPSVLATLPKTSEVELQPLPRDTAEALAAACTSDALDPLAKKRWARLGGGVPLAVVEAIAWGIASGDIAWNNDRGVPRTRTAGRGKIRTASELIRLRARDESEGCRMVLALVAMLGGEAKVPRLARILEAAARRIDVDVAVEEAIRARWLADTQEDWVALPSRTHRDALATLLDEDVRREIHHFIANVIESEEGVFGRVEAAWHAAQANDGTRASRIVLEAAKATAEAHLEASTTQLIAFARRADPSCEEAALELLANALENSPSIAPAPGSAPPPLAFAPPPPRLPVDADGEEPDSMIERALIVDPDGRSHKSVVSSSPPAATYEPELERQDSEPPTLMKEGLAPMAPNGGVPHSASSAASSHPGSGPPPSSQAPGSKIALRLGELAKDALLSADNAALERWVDGLRAAGESPIFTERMRAMARLGRGDIGDALRVLRRTRAQLDPQDHRLRCQTSLAMGVALSVAGRPQEALLEAMDALARARQIGDERGAKACLAFLAKLYTSVEKIDDAEKLRAISI